MSLPRGEQGLRPFGQSARGRRDRPNPPFASEAPRHAGTMGLCGRRTLPAGGPAFDKGRGAPAPPRTMTRARFAAEWCSRTPWRSSRIAVRTGRGSATPVPSEHGKASGETAGAARIGGRAEGSRPGGSGKKAVDRSAATDLVGLLRLKKMGSLSPCGHRCGRDAWYPRIGPPRPVHARKPRSLARAATAPRPAWRVSSRRSGRVRRRNSRPVCGGAPGRNGGRERPARLP